MRIYSPGLLLCILFLSGCTKTEPHTEVPLRADLAGFHRTVTTQSELSQKYFDQGQTW